jgi:hypothetical protein
VEESTSGGYYCQKCSNNLLVRKIDGLCGELLQAAMGVLLSVLNCLSTLILRSKPAAAYSAGQSIPTI